MTREQEIQLSKHLALLHGCSIWFTHELEKSQAYTRFMHPDRRCPGCGYRSKEGAD